MNRLVCIVATCLLACGGAKKDVVPPRAVAPAPPPAPTWSFFSDVERIGDVVPTPQRVWALAQGGDVVSWDRQKGTFHAETGVTGATALAVAPGGVMYVGRTSGVSWQDGKGGWTHSGEGPLRAGVTALAPRKGGGVWVGTAGAFGYVHEGQMKVLSERYRVRGLAATGGTAWIATARFGVVTLQGDRLVEYTTGQGVCGNQIAAIHAAAGGVAVTCAGPGARMRFSLWSGGRWFTYATQQLGTLRAVHPFGDRLLVDASAGRFWLRAAPAGAPVTASGPRARAIPPVGGPEPPAPPQPKVAAPAAPEKPPVAAKPAGQAPKPNADRAIGLPMVWGRPVAQPAPEPKTTAPPAGPRSDLARDLAAMTRPKKPKQPVDVKLPPPVPMPSPITGSKPAPLARAILPSVRAPSSAAGGTGAPPLDAKAQRWVLPAGAKVTAIAVGADGTQWYALAHRGLMAVRGDERRRYTSLTLVPRDESTRLVLDGKGRAVLPVSRAYILRWADDAWRRLRVAKDDDARVLAVRAGPKGRLWALVLPAAKAETPTPPAAAPAPPEQVAEKPAPETPARVSPAAGEGVEAIPIAAPVQTDAPPPQHVLRMLRTTGPGEDEFYEIATFPVIGLEGAPRFGRMIIDPAGEVYVPLFWTDKGGVSRGAGLAHLRGGLTTVDVWGARLGYESADRKGPPLLPDAWVNAVARAADGTIYAATNSGLVEVQKGKVRVFDENDFIDSEVILDVAVDPKGRVWAGTLEGLGYIEGGEWKAVRHRGLEGKVGTVTTEFGGRIWLGTPAGVWRGDGAEFDVVRVGDERGIGDVRDIALDTAGGVWVLTSQGVFHKPAR